MTIFNNLQKQRGISIIGAIFALIILGIFGAAIVALMSAEQEFRAGQLSQDWAFYNVQAGLEYAIREVDQGGFETATIEIDQDRCRLVLNKPFGRGSFTVGIDYVEGDNDCSGLGGVTSDCIVVSSAVGTVQKLHMITHFPFAADCLDVNIEDVTLGGINNTDVEEIKLRKVCNEAVTIDKMQISWEPHDGERVALIKIQGNPPAWESIDGVPSGTIIDIEDIRLTGLGVSPINVIRFTSDMSDKTLTLRYIMTDCSMETVSFPLP